jgi:hypothetical protein
MEKPSISITKSPMKWRIMYSSQTLINLGNCKRNISKRCRKTHKYSILEFVKVVPAAKLEIVKASFLGVRLADSGC